MLICDKHIAYGKWEGLALDRQGCSFVVYVQQRKHNRKEVSREGIAGLYIAIEDHYASTSLALY